MESGFDSVAHYHYLVWKIRCGEATSTEFQRLVEEAMAKLQPGFIKVQPYGRQGDKKSDGLYWEDGTQFQVYSPHEYKQSELLRKIEEDLEGAVAQQKGLRRWVFVYNTRFGLYPDVEALLAEQRSRHSNITIEPLSSEDLWARIRDELDVQQRAEILLAAPPLDSSFLSPAEIGDAVEQRLKTGRFVVVQGVLSPIDISAAVEAIAPDLPVLPVQPAIPWPIESWAEAFELQRCYVEEMMEEAAKAFQPRFAIFSMAPLPLAMQLGFLISDRVDAKAFHYDRVRNVWSWDATLPKPAVDFAVSGIPDSELPEVTEAVLRVSLSAHVRAEDTVAVVGRHDFEVDISVPEPDVLWLSHPDQMQEFEKLFRQVLAEIARLAPNCEIVHLFFAGPTACAVSVGRALNRNMHPALRLYQYDRSRSPRYEAVATL